MQPEEVKKLIETGLPGAQAQVYSNDGAHFEATVICEDFAGKTMVKQHQMVYVSLGNNIQLNEIHALSLKTYTPQEWEKVRKPD
ncbi:MAG: BolA family transcriptional regulator [Candidatus Parabeggiatoa sp. nov. 2]|nr:MAG: BolA family transcriptional regulator [Beggiatoa sp. 4572_84]RKZ62710.1 MAG: BolA family transcriptional regulator [Gammaproteobacteria bacterium]